MRVDDFLSTVGIIKRRTVAKEMATNGLIESGGRKLKASHQVAPGEILNIKGSNPFTVEILKLPTGSVPKEKRDEYFRTLTE